MKKLLLNLIALLLVVAVYGQPIEMGASLSAESYADQVKTTMTTQYSLSAEQATKIYEISLKTARHLKELEDAKGQITQTVYEQKRANILKYGEAFIQRQLNKAQLTQYRKDKLLEERPQRIQERREAAMNNN